MTTNSKPSITTGYKFFSILSVAIIILLITKHFVELYDSVALRNEQIFTKESQLISYVINEVESKVSNKESLSLFIKEKFANLSSNFLLLDKDLEPILISNQSFLRLYNSYIKGHLGDLSKNEGIIQRTSSEILYYKKIPQFSCILVLGAPNDVLEITLVKNIFTSSIIMVGFVILLFIFYLKYIFPFKILSTDIVSGFFSGRVKYPRNIKYKEMSDISYAIRSMEEAIANEKLTNSKLQVEIETVRKNNKDLELKIPKIGVPNINNEFLNNLSHEVRTPIQGISAISKGLIDNWNNFDNKTNYDLATKIANNAQRLLTLVSNLLDISKPRSGGIKLRFKRINLVDLVKDMLKECRSLYVDKNDIILEIDTQIPENTDILVDPDKITQVLRNLFGNAIKVTQFGKITTIITSNSDDFVQVAIVDDGIGIPPEELESIFIPFVQSSRTKGNLSGVGLGLSTSKEIINAHGGKIWAENNEKKGAKFIFTLPLPKELRNKTKDSIAAPEVTTRANIVIIDDEETCLLSLSMMLYKTNYILHEYTSSIKGLEFIRNNPDKVDILLLDMMMPELDGLEVLEKLKSDSNLKDTSVIMQTGVADESQMEKSWEMGIKDFLRKPYTKETLIASIENVLGLKKKK